MRCHPADRAADYLQRGWWSADTIDALLRARVAEFGDQPALVDPPNLAELTGNSPGRWTWTELAAQVDSLAAYLLSLGVRAGNVVAVQLPNSGDLVRAFLAIVRIGARSPHLSRCPTENTSWCRCAGGLARSP
ncbi:AMP-binding protein [Fodinicola feengrottensis]|uniref:AMP-binding protein n=1 Tax=Fodinicola feengrottensis TaxID=435914 RepID=UPI002441AB36|nr:AMP-binding protein [Fodinicola feengrottensis]